LLDNGGHTILLVERHDAGHKYPPHRVNYRAIALGLKAAGATCCLATAAVGSLQPNWGPGSMAVCADFIDLTGRNQTLFDRQVEHRDFSIPMGQAAQCALRVAAARLSPQAHPAATYICANGPRYETPAEVAFARQIGGDVVGMTAASEAVAMGEAGIDYGCLAIVTNLASGIGNTPLSHAEVLQEMDRSGELAVKILLDAVGLLWD
jgi:5'-methylthioadenosine phosphorylase